jgi:histidyl-tRNA synthetase
MLFTASAMSRYAVSAFAPHSKRLIRTTPPFRLAAEGGGQVSNAVQDKDVLSKSGGKNFASSQVKLDTNPPKGTRDFYPEDMRLRTWLFDQWRQVAKTYAFSEYDAPVLGK